MTTQKNTSQTLAFFVRVFLPCSGPCMTAMKVSITIIITIAIVGLHYLDPLPKKGDPGS